MSSTHRFDVVVAQLGELISRSTGDLVVEVEDAARISETFKKVIEKMTNKRLAMVNVKPELSEKKDVFTITAKLREDSAAVGLPGFHDLLYEVNGANVVLTVTDGGTEDGVEQECGFEVRLEASVDFSSLDPNDKTDAHLPLQLVVTDDPVQELTVGDVQKPVALNLEELAKKSDFGDARDEILAIAQKIRLNKVNFQRIKVKVDDTKEARLKKVRSLEIVFGLTFGPVRIGMNLAANRNADDSFDRKTFEFGGELAKDSGDVELGDLIDGIAGSDFWPSALSMKLHSVSLERKLVEEYRQIDPAEKTDTMRIELRSPARSDNPSLLIRIANDGVDRKIIAARVGWHDLHIVDLPLVDNAVSLDFQPLFTFFTSKTTTIEKVVLLCDLDDFDDLKTLGKPPDKLKTEIRRGMYGAGILNFGDAALRSVLHFPIWVSKSPQDELPFDPAEPEEVTPVVVPPKAKWLKDISPKFENGRVTVIARLAFERGEFKIEPMLGLSFLIREPEPGESRVALESTGAALSYARDGLTISGGLVRLTDKPGPADWFGTGLLVYGENFALGTAFTFQETGQAQFFLFGYLRRQLGGPAWCYVTGLALGFGYNRSFTPPPVDKVREFPLIDIARRLSSGQDPVKQKMDMDGLMKIADGLRTYVKPEDGTIFGTVGVTFSTFGYMNSTVLMTLSVGTSLQFSIIGNAVIDKPADEPAVHADLQIVAAVKPADGFLGLDAVLGPNSYVLSKGCRLTGGFSLRTWFQGPHAKDFVISLGGYHPRYQKPSHYPSVPRLGFLWKISSTTRMSGFAYLAITPNNIQLGGGMDLLYEAGPLRAWAHLEVHILLGWSPFVYDAQLSIDLGVSFRMDLLFCSTTISVDIGADVHIWGPEFSGHADVHLWFVSFGFSFGDYQKTPETALVWNDFINTFVTPVPREEEKKPLVLEGGAPAEALPFDIVPLAGAVAAEGGKPVTWIVDPQLFELKVASTIPAKTARFNSETVNDLATPIFALPVANHPQIDPVLSVTVKRTGLFAEQANAAANVFQMQCDAPAANAPAALWGPKRTDAEALSGGKENVPGILQLMLAPKPYQPAQSVSIDVNVLLFHEAASIDRAWNVVKVQEKAFTWKNDNPFATASSPAVTQRRNTMLEALKRNGVIAQDADMSVDVRHVKAEWPCFLVDPQLRTLGAKAA